MELNANGKGIAMGKSDVFNRMLRHMQRKPGIAPEERLHDPQHEMPLSDELDENLRRLQEIYADCADIIFHEFLIGECTRAVLVYFDGLSDVNEIAEHVLAPLQREFTGEHHLADIRHHITASYIKPVADVAEVIEEISGGNPVLLMERERTGLSLGLPRWEKRSVDEPEAESVLRGPREGFIETVRVNTALLRRKLRNPNLKMKLLTVGTGTGTQIVVAYMKGIAAPALVDEVVSRLQRIEIDGVLGSTYIEELIEDNPYSPFPQLLSTERPDVAAAYLLEGHVVLMIDGTPNAMVAPATFFAMLQSPEDYYERYVAGTAIRWLRYIFFALSLLGPSIYVAVITFHQEMIPTPLLLTMARSREQIPFPALVEALLMESMFEALREAGARLPKQIGSAVSIVGALVIGQAAISAGIVSAPMVMVVAITGVASFMAPRFTFGIAVRLLRFPMMLLSGFLGFLGVIMGIIIILDHLIKLRSFGVPYLSPLAPMQSRQLKDVLWRAPRWKLITRPHLTGPWNPVREPAGQRPGRDQGDEGG